MNDKPVKCSQTLTFNDENARPLYLTFDITDADYTLIVGTDIKKYADTMNRGKQRKIIIKLPEDKGYSKLPIYMDGSGSEKRLRLVIVPQPDKNRMSKMPFTTSNRSHVRAIKPLAKQIQRYMHAPADEVKGICKDEGILDDTLKRAMDKISDIRDICA